MDGAQRLLAATRGEIEAITALQKEFQRQVEALLEEHRARIRALMRTRAHQEIEERCLAAQLRLDDLELPDPQATAERERLRSERKSLLGVLEGIAAQVQQDTSRLQSAAGMVSLGQGSAPAPPEPSTKRRAAEDDYGQYLPWKDPEVVRRVYEAALARAVRQGDEGVAQSVRGLLLDVEASLR
mmetsp:Transcript_70894/g.184849  ORF Transcript_70894/g.184849 Transcript_70894/m.184849 type:complete len:184 (+) Transcript_70894:73-624(+)